LDSRGWRFEGKVGSGKARADGAATIDHVHPKLMRLRTLYERVSDNTYTGNITVPILFDKKLDTIVNNESSEIIRMLNSEFNELSSLGATKAAALDLYPAALRSKIDAVNEWVYPSINNGVYRCGFAKTQAAYDSAYVVLRDGLARAEALLSSSRYCAGDTFTEADVRLFTTLVRFDAVYATHFKCNMGLIQYSYPSLWGFVKEVYQMTHVAATTNMEHIKLHYYGSHESVNPLGIVPVGFTSDFTAAHGRDTQKYVAATSSSAAASSAASSEAKQ
jgi:putative glutathione S-transferase